MELRVLLVDDEKLVRKSLEALFPWKEYGMTVAGEASTGEEALTWLARHEADVAFVDLSMPVMDGFALLRAINLEYPAMVKVVLSCHAEVKYIQRTIGEGIAGYVLKTDFDMEEIHALLKRVRDMALRSRDRPLTRGLLAGCTRTEWEADPHPGTEALWLGERLVLLEGEGKLTALLPQNPESMLVSLTEEQMKRLRLAPERAQAVVQRQLFYEAREGARVCGLTMLPPLTGEAAQALEDQLLEGGWLLSGHGCKQLQAQLEAVRFPADRLIHAVGTLREELQGALSSPALDENWRQVVSTALPRWLPMRDFMDALRQALLQRLRSAGVYADSAMVVLRALRIIRDPKKLFARADDVAAMVGFNRSHFSRCFSRLMGVSYRDYTRQMRLRWVQQQLQAGWSTAEMAASLDYINVEYFCRVYNIKPTEDENGGK